MWMLLFTAAAGTLAAQQSPRDVLQPQTYRMLSGIEPTPGAQLHVIEVQLRQCYEQHVALLRSVAVLTQQVQDIEKRIDIDRAQLDAANPSHEVERLTRLEEFVKNYAREDEAERATVRARWDRISSWAAVIFSGLLALGGNEVIKRMQAHFRHARQLGTLNAIKEEVVVLKEQTSDRMDQLLSSSGKVEHAAGVAEGIAEEKGRPAVSRPSQSDFDV